jgi:hypothetical protein
LIIALRYNKIKIKFGGEMYMERFISVMCVIALALTAFSGVVFAETADSLYGLAVNTHADPDGVEMPITFSWKL